MNSQITRYFPPGMKFVSPEENDDLKIAINYFDNEQIVLVPEPWANFRYGTGYEGIKLFYRDKLINLRFQPTFLDQYNHIPGTSAEAYVSILDKDFHSGQFIENDKFEVWYYDILEKVYWHIGQGTIQQVIDKTINCWIPKAFTVRYKTRLALLKDTEGFRIDIADALSRLSFINQFHILLADDIEHRFQVELEFQDELLSKEQLKELINAVSYLSYESTRYRINYENCIDENNMMTFKSIRILFATWNNKEFVTIKFFQKCDNHHIDLKNNPL